MSARFSSMPKYFVLLLGVFLTLSCQKNSSSQQRHEPSWSCHVLPCSDCKIQSYKDQSEQVRREKLNQLRAQISASFLMGSILYVIAALCGAGVAEYVRKRIAHRFSLSVVAQICLAISLYACMCFAIILFTIFNKYLIAVWMPILILLSASAYPFFLHVIPSLKDGDVTRRKAAVSQIKSFFMLIFIFYVILSILSPEGFRDIQLR